MNVTINVDETLFKDIIEKELKAFNTEELHEIIKDLIKQYLMQSNVVESLFVTSSSPYSNNNKKEPTKLLSDIVKRIDINDDCNEIKDKIVEEIKSNSRSIVTALIAKAISRQLFEFLTSDYMLEGIIQNSIMDAMNNK